ncbi:MAG: zinc-ribbon domain-containing protein [Candidatus Thiodiazotropha sp.]
MTTIAEFKQQINNLNIEESINGEISSIQDAKQTKKTCIDCQRELRQIKKSIGLEIKTIRSEYRDKIANAGSVVGGAFSLFGKRGLGGSIRADAKRGMTRERDDVIAPYEELKLLIDNFIHSIDDVKNQLSKYIQEAKEVDSQNKITSSNNASSRFCTSCGAKAAKSHKFCSQCGAELE